MKKIIEKRKNLRCRNYKYNTSGYYFITICTDNHRCIFGTVTENVVNLSGLGRIVDECLRDVSNHYRTVFIKEHIIMPNHVHFVLYICSDTEITHIGSVINHFKGAVSRISRMKKIWQRNYYEHIIRTKNEYDEIAQYIVNNPLRWYYDKENPENW